MAGLTNEELGLNEKGFPPTDETGDVDLFQIEYHLSLTPAQRLKQIEEFAEFIFDAWKARGFEWSDSENY
ncbi:MAG TPA: hypothetical protein VHD56_19590 [Tepidisphaeraceae bacterium]|nr:hypothetical protein [Tepidisphaeraceae bacterium]